MVQRLPVSFVLDEALEKTLDRRLVRPFDLIGIFCVRNDVPQQREIERSLHPRQFQAFNGESVLFFLLRSLYTSSSVRRRKAGWVASIPLSMTATTIPFVLMSKTRFAASAFTVARDSNSVSDAERLRLIR